jgi:nitroreductase
MEVLEAIRTRRSAKRVTEKSPSKRDIEEVLEAALWAPNHHFTEPWRFHVIANDERAKMGEHIAAAIERESRSNGDSEAAAAADARKALLRSPVVIAVTVRGSEDPVVELEDYAAACCAIQNLTLAAWSKGVVSKWRTGDMCTYRSAKEYLDVSPEDRIVGFIYLGYPARNAVGEGRRRSHECIRWVGWDE